MHTTCQHVRVYYNRVLDKYVTLFCCKLNNGKKENREERHIEQKRKWNDEFLRVERCENEKNERKVVGKTSVESKTIFLFLKQERDVVSLLYCEKERGKLVK